MRRSEGFTLLEVMISIAILAIALLAVSNFQGSSLRASRRAEKLAVAVQLGRQKMSEKVMELETAIDKGEFPDDKSEEGDFGEDTPGVRWMAEIKKMEAPPVPATGKEGEGATEQMMAVIGEKLSQMVRTLRVTVYWKELLEEESFDLTTHIANIRTGLTTTTVQTGVAPATGDKTPGGEPEGEEQ